MNNKIFYQTERKHRNNQLKTAEINKPQLKEYKNMKANIIELHSQDIENCGIDISKINRDQFELIAEKLADQFDQDFYANLDIVLKEMEIIK